MTEEWAGEEQIIIVSKGAAQLKFELFPFACFPRTGTK